MRQMVAYGLFRLIIWIYPPITAELVQMVIKHLIAQGDE